MRKYDDALLVKDALPVYFAEYHFAGGGYDKKWFRIKLGPLFIPLPNIKSRVDAVKIHDIHHLVTEYNADWKGEVEIGAWEIAAGCERVTVAWLLNLGSFFIGIFFFPTALYKAFMKGRHTITSLYYNTNYEKLLNKSLGELRSKLGVDRVLKNSVRDQLLFFAWCIIALIYHITLLAVFLFVVYKVFIFLI